MKRVLFVRRQSEGGLAQFTDALAFALESEGFDVVVDDAQSWIPNETGFQADRKVSKQFKEAVKGFDMVHAFGYRAAWAASEAFYLKFPWVYTAWDMPKTTVSQLIDRLNAGRLGICPTRAVKKALEEGDAVNLEIVTPGVWVPEDGESKEEARTALGMDEQSELVVLMGPFGPDSGAEEAVQSLREVQSRRPGTPVAVVGDWKGSELPESFIRAGKGFDRMRWLQAAEVVVVSDERAGFSMTAGEAMMLGRAVIVRRAGGLPEMGVENVHIEVFEGGLDLTELVLDVLTAPIHREAMGDAARVRALDRFNLGLCAAEHARIYRDLLARR